MITNLKHQNDILYYDSFYKYYYDFCFLFISLCIVAFLSLLDFFIPKTCSELFSKFGLKYNYLLLSSGIIDIITIIIFFVFKSKPFNLFYGFFIILLLFSLVIINILSLYVMVEDRQVLKKCNVTTFSFGFISCIFTTVYALIFLVYISIFIYSSYKIRIKYQDIIFHV